MAVRVSIGLKVYHTYRLGVKKRFQHNISIPGGRLNSKSNRLACLPNSPIVYTKVRQKSSLRIVVSLPVTSPIRVKSSYRRSERNLLNILSLDVYTKKYKRIVLNESLKLAIWKYWGLTLKSLEVFIASPPFQGSPTPRTPTTLQFGWRSSHPSAFPLSSIFQSISISLVDAIPSFRMFDWLRFQHCFLCWWY
jgi:hypothetical protein